MPSVSPFSISMAQRKPPNTVGPKIERQLSIKVYDSENHEVVHAQCSYVQLKKPSLPPKPSSTKAADELPNYMKPTSSFVVRKDKLQVTVPSVTPAVVKRSQKNTKGMDTSNAIPSFPVPHVVTHAKVHTRQSTLRPVRPSIRKSSAIDLYHHYTCSSTVKNFPKSSDLRSKKTLPKDTSFIKVCPYTYCSVHGHKHESLPPLTTFLSSRRQLFKNQNNMKHTSQSFIEKGILGKSNEVSDTRSASGFDFSSKIEVANGFFMEIYAEAHEERNEVTVHTKDTINAMSIREEDSKICEAYYFGSSGGGHCSQSYVDDIDDEMKSLKYVECDQQVEYVEDKAYIRLTEGEGNSPMPCQGTACDLDEERSYPEVRWGDGKIRYVKDGDDVGSTLDNEKCSERCDKSQHNTDILSENFEEKVNAKAEKDSSSLSHVELSDGTKELKEAPQVAEEDENIETHIYNCFCYISPDEISTGKHHNRSENEQHKGTIQSEGDISQLLAEDYSEATYDSSLDRKPKPTYHIITTQNVKEMRNFNPRAPCFLPEESDQEAEKVVLRHKMMDERRAVEEWMIDYALQQAVKRLAPPQERNVSLLIEAFETIIPLPIC